MRSGTCTSGPRCSFFFFNDTATTEIYPLSLHDALPISALPKAGVLHERAADAARAHQHDAVVAAQAQDVADAGGELGDGIPQAALTERAEEREVLPHLRGGRAAAPGELGRGDAGLALGVELLEDPQVQREPSHRGLGNLPHCELFHNPALQRKSRTKASGSSVSGRAAGSRSRAASPALTWAAARPGAAPSTLRSCLRRRGEQAGAKGRKGAISPGRANGTGRG